MTHHWRRARLFICLFIIALLLQGCDEKKPKPANEPAAAVENAPLISIYVSTTGNDQNSGSDASPVATLSRAYELVKDLPDASEIVIRAGVYAQNLTMGGWGDSKDERKPPLRIRAARDARSGAFETVVLDGGQAITQAEPVAGKPGVFKLTLRFAEEERPHIWEEDTRIRYVLVADIAAVERFPGSMTLDGESVVFSTSDGKAPDAHKLGISRMRTGITAYRHNVAIQGLQFRNFLLTRFAAGIEMRRDDAVVEDCQFWNALRGIQLFDNLSNGRIVRCSANDVGGGIYSTAKGTIVEDCRFFRTRDRFMPPVYSQDDNGIQCYFNAEGGEIRRNLCVGFGNGIFIKTVASKFIVEHNTLVMTAARRQAINGFEHGIGCTEWWPASSFRRNIVTGFSVPVLGAHVTHGATVDENCFWNSSEARMSRTVMELRKGKAGFANLIADPWFAAPDKNDFRLLPGSPCATPGKEGVVLGALPLITKKISDIQPPQVSVKAAAPAVQVPHFEPPTRQHDPLAGGRNSSADLSPDDPSAAYATPTGTLELNLDAYDAGGPVTQMSFKVGDAPWGSAEKFQARKTLTLTGNAATKVGARVADRAGNWSAPVFIEVWPLTEPPALAGRPVVRANSHGALIELETTIPCRATLEFGPTTAYGAAFTRPRNLVFSRSNAYAGQSDTAPPARTHQLALIPAQAAPGAVYHYRIRLESALGDVWSTPDATVKLEGGTRTFHVSPNAADGDGSSEKPWPSINFAANRALPGDRVVLMPGIYAGENNISHGGTAHAPITFEAQRPGSAILDGHKEIANCLQLEKSPHVVIDGLEVRWFMTAGIAINASPGATIRNCRIWNEFWGIWFTGSGIVAVNSPCIIERNLMFALEEGIWLMNCPGSRVTHNTSLLNLYGGAKFINSIANTVSKNNSFAFSGNDQFYIEEQDPKAMGTFESDYNNVGTSLREPEPGDEIKTTDRVMYGGSKAVISLNGRRFNSLRAWQAETGRDKHSIFKHPQFIDPPTRDFRLKPGSPNASGGENGAIIGALPVAR